MYPRRVFTVLLVAVFASGCFGTRIRSGAARSTVTQEELGFSLFWGLTQSDTVAPECQFGMAETESWLPWYASLLYTITLGIVTPVKKKYTCAMGPTPPPVSAPR
ncbi:MAG: hypothetical protein AB1730_27050 [Myxococcota bacterium]